MCAPVLLVSPVSSCERPLTDWRPYWLHRIEELLLYLRVLVTFVMML